MEKKTSNRLANKNWCNYGYRMHNTDFKNILKVHAYKINVLLYMLVIYMVIPVKLNAQRLDTSNSASVNELVLANRVLSSAEVGLLDTYGQVSFRNPKNPNRYFIARRMAPGIVTAYDIYESDLDGNPVTAKQADLYPERYIHGEIYKANPHINAIVYVQTPELVAFGISSVPLLSGKPIPIIDFQVAENKYADFCSDLSIRKKIAKSLEVSNAVLLPGHGAFITGTSIVDMVSKATKLRENASVQIQTANLRGKVNVLEFGPRQGSELVSKPDGGSGSSGNSARRPWEYWTQLVAGEIKESNSKTASTNAPAPLTDQDDIDELVLANRILSSPELGIIGAYGHVSVRSRKHPNRYYISTDVSPGIVTVHDIMENDLDSKAIHDTRTQYEERFIHGEIYKARPDVMAIVHAHTSEFVAFGLSSVPLLPVFDKASFIGNGLPIFDIRKYTGGGPAPVGCAHCISTTELGKAMANELGNKPAILLYGHGIVVTGTSIADMVSKTNYLRKNAAIQQMAISLGGKLSYQYTTAVMDSQQIDDAVTYLSNWEFWKKTLTSTYKKEKLDK